jgi:hypothetical protein
VSRNARTGSIPVPGTDYKGVTIAIVTPFLYPKVRAKHLPNKKYYAGQQGAQLRSKQRLHPRKTDRGKGLEFKETKPTRYLQPGNRQRIVGIDMKSLEKEKDVAIFLMFTGLSYTDY